VTVQSEGGFHTEWLATNLAAQGIVAVGDHSLEIAREARKRTDFETDLRDAIDDATLDLAQLATAGQPVGGRCAVILRADAMLHGGGLGVWRVFADHATAESERQGLTRYRQGMPVAPGVDQIPEPLSITSNGALDFGARSAPVDDDGSAVRRFALIEHGVAAGLGLSAREAARRQVEPNGGVRNLVIARGTWTEALPASGRTIDVHRLRSLSIDPYTGDASLELGLSLDNGQPFAGGTVRLDLVAALARGRRSARAVRRGAYIGPAALLIEDAELLA
jgi:predicted Zn-dependent protease